MTTVILGSVISGISAGYHLKQKGISNIIFEKDNDFFWGGVNSFSFDRFGFGSFLFWRYFFLCVYVWFLILLCFL